jgi:prepilin-type processing-associated H-X9-DG protein
VIADSSTRTTPASIDADRAAGTVEIAWADGHVSRFDAETLRWLCPCAFCRGEAGMPGWLDSRPTLSPNQTKLVDVRLVGQYALQPIWGDGHATGYYAFAMLREQCPCAEDAARRGRADAIGNETPPPFPHRHEERPR